MSRDICHAKQPEKTTDLIETLQDDNTGEEEKHALEALKSEMVLCFRDTPKSRYWKEAMLISAVATGDEYESLVYGFAKAIKESRALAPQVVRYFAGCLRWGAPKIPDAENWFGLLLEGLTEHLVVKNEATDLRMIYLLTDAIGTLLDAMVERNFKGIDRLKVHEPLMKKLSALKKNEEPRMAQAAQYALQSLRRVPDDEGAWEEALRWTGVGLKAVAKVSSGVTKLDISQVIDAGPSLLELVSGLGGALKAAVDTWEACESLKDLVQVIRNKADRKDWYYVLTRSKIFIQLGTYADLQTTIQGLKCCEKSEFWCGLYSQLERQWHSDLSSRDNILTFIEWTFKESSWKAAYDRDAAIDNWVGLLADSLQKPQLKSQLPKRKQNPLRKLRESKLLSRQAENPEPRLKPSFLEGQMDITDDRNLLNDAFERSKTALAFYADAILAQHYTCGNLLHIKRLSGQDLPIENCYINLSLIEYEKGSDGKQKGDDRSSLFKRLESEAPKTEKDVSLEHLFQGRKLRNGLLGRPKRVLIRGRAGVGKTTLCKKITHAFLHGGLWREHYDRLIWIPLRNLKRNRGYNSYVALIEEEMFGQVSGKARFWEAFKSKLEDLRTLFLLDGLDEIAGDAENINTFQSLLNRQNVLITTRPHAAGHAGISQYDLEIDTVGFLDHQIEAYVDKVCDPPVASQIKDFTSQHWMLRGLMRIPIQLDAFCFTWEEGIDLARPLTTMTALYQEIEIKLWKKDIPRISPSKMSDAQDDPSDCHFRAELQRIIPKEFDFDFLQSIAFLGMYNNVTEFSRYTRDQFRLHFSNLAMTDRVLKETSFLRSSESSSPYTQTFYFLHLTFQEYFAAWNFVQSWKSGAEINTLDVESGKALSLHPEDFIQREKYNGRFNIMWRFVSGILGMSHKRPEEDTAKLFQQFEMKPRDLLGRAHAQLLMCCLNEISENIEVSTIADIRRKVDYQLSQLLLIDRPRDIGIDPDMPERVLLACLEKGDEKQQLNILGDIRERPQIFFDLSRQIWQLYKSHRRRVNGSTTDMKPSSLSSKIVSSAAKSIGRFSVFSSEEVLEILHDPNEDVLSNGMYGLQERRSDSISHEIFHGVADILFSPTKRNYYWNFELPRDILQYLASQISSGCDCRILAVRFLARSYLPNKDGFDQFLESLDDPKPEVRGEVLQALRNHCNLPKSLCNRMVQIIQRDPSSFEVHLALWVLEVQQALPPEVVDQMWDVLEFDDAISQGTSFSILHRQGLLHEDVIMKRFTESLCQDLFAIGITKGAHIHGISPPRTILDHCVSIIKTYGAGNLQAIDPESKGPEEDIAVNAVWALSDCRSLPEHVIHTLWEFVDCGKVGNRIQWMLAAQERIPDFIVNGILQRRLQRIDQSQDFERVSQLHDLDRMFKVPLPDFAIARVAGFASEGESSAVELLSRQKISLHSVKHLATLFLSRKTRQHGDTLARNIPGFREFVCSLGREYWISQFGMLFSRDIHRTVSCWSQDDQIHVLGDDESWATSIEQPERRQHMEAALDAIERDIENLCGGAWSALGLWSLNRKSFL